MNTIKITGISIGIIIVLLVLVSFLLPRKVVVERSGIINASAEQIFEQVNTMENWVNWSPWHKIDTNTVYTFNEISVGEGASYSWVSEDENVGKGSLTIIKSIPNDSIAAELFFEGQGKSICYYTFKQTDAGIEFKMGMISDAAYNPMARYFNLLIDKFLGKDFEAGIANMKQYCENNLIEDSLTIKEITFEGVTFIGIKDSCTVENIGIKTGQIFGELMPFIGQNMIKPISSPIAIYYSFSPEKVVFEIGLPIEASVKVKTNNRIKINELPKSEVVIANHYGAYDKLALTYAEIDKWFAENNKTRGKLAWEEYITDPRTEKDTTKWLTKVYYQLN